jgi:hypothetical protein
MTAIRVRREKAALSSGCKSHPHIRRAILEKDYLQAEAETAATWRRIVEEALDGEIFGLTRLREVPGRRLRSSHPADDALPRRCLVPSLP